MTDCGCNAVSDSPAQQRVFSLALALNTTMFVVGLVAGLITQSPGWTARAEDRVENALGEIR